MTTRDVHEAPVRARESARPVAGIIRYGAYLPHRRLERAAIAGALGRTPGRDTGSRSVGGFDEDTTSMDVEAARRASAVGILDD